MVSSNMNADNNFQFLTILHRIWLLGPKMVKFWPNQLGIRANIILNVMNYFSTKCYLKKKVHF